MSWSLSGERLAQGVNRVCRSWCQDLWDEELADMLDAATSGISERTATPSTVHQQYVNLFDHATALPGWPLLIDRTRMALARAARRDVLVGVIVFDDVTRGSSMSPDFNACVAAFRDSVFPDDTVARIDGRTFVFVLNDVDNAETLAEAAHHIVDALDIRCQIGMAFGALPCDPEELINQAREDAVPPPPPPVPGWEDQYILGTDAA
jgi:GGDEF domain-containing protein